MVNVKARPKIGRSIGCVIAATALSAILAVPAFAVEQQSLSSVSLTVRDDYISVTAPTSIPVSISSNPNIAEYGHMSFPSDLKVVNNRLLPVYVTGIQANCTNKFWLVEDPNAQLPRDLSFTYMNVKARVGDSTMPMVNLKPNESVPIQCKINAADYAQVSTDADGNSTAIYYNYEDLDLSGTILRHGVQTNSRYEKDKAITPMNITLKFSTEDPSAQV